MQDGIHFSNFIYNIRTQKSISLQTLCEGLCTFQEISYLETGTRSLDRLLQDELLDRLGVGAEDYEHFLGYKDYERWLKRQRILHAITFQNFDTAGERLEEYHRIYCQNAKKIRSTTRNKLEKQFYLSMVAQLRRCQGIPGAELYSLYSQALHLTVPMYGQKPLNEMVLSLKEINLILEAEHYQPEGERSEKYFEMVNYIESKKLDRRGMAKIYPKAVYFLCRSVLKLADAEEKQDQKSEGFKDVHIIQIDIPLLLQYCNQAVEILRDNERMYFLWELLNIRDQLLNRLMKTTGYDETLETLRLENTEWNCTLLKIYNRFGVPAETFDDCFLYVIKGVHCINDVIHIRRKMLEISPAELCEGICDIKTLKRLEERQTTPQRAVVELLFERLGLSGELTRTELITANPEARELMEQLSQHINDQQIDTAWEYLRKIKLLVSAEPKQNQQTFLRYEFLFRLKRKEININEYLAQMQQVLGLTLPYEAFLKEGEKYLTHEEQSCIQNRMKALKLTCTESLSCIHRFEDIYLPFIKNELQETITGMYDFIMSSMGSKWGNMGEHDIADNYSRTIIQGCLRFRRLGNLEIGLYDLWWNYSERKKKSIPVTKTLDDIEELTICLILSKLAKHKYGEHFFQNKIKYNYFLSVFNSS